MDKKLFADIETVPEYPVLAEAPEHVQKFFKNRYSGALSPTPELLQDFYEKSVSLYAEFSMIVCISCAVLVKDVTYKFKSFYIENAMLGEDDLLRQFTKMLNDLPTSYVIVGHNSNQFDIPFICKRMIKHRIKIPRMLNPTGKKTWDINHIDTMNVAKFGNYQGAVSLDNLCYMLGIKSPKQDTDGSMVSNLYHVEKDMPRIVRYCEADVVALIMVADCLLEFYTIEKEIIITH